MILTIASKDFKAFFNSPLAWVLLCFIQLIESFNFLKHLDEFLQLQPQFIQMSNPPGATVWVAVPALTTTAALFLFVVPLLAMRLIAEERAHHTLCLLTSAPIRLTDIVLGKFLALMGFLLIALALVALMPLSLFANTPLDYPFLACLLLGLALLAAAFSALCLYASSLTKTPIIAAISSLGGLFLLLLFGDHLSERPNPDSLGWLSDLIQVFSPVKNFEVLHQGLLDSYAVVCLLLMTIFFLILTIRTLESQRLKG
ncbi:MAG: ABC transporter permease subunit [Betaproteobacteria bacterium]